MRTDILIIGQGLAGTHLAHRCIKEGLSVLVIDQNHHQAASKVAAGMINPIKGKRLALLWEDETDYHTSMAVYHDLEQTLKTPLIRNLEMIRLIDSHETIEHYERKRLDPLRAKYLQNKVDPKEVPECHATPLMLKIPGVKQVDTQSLLDKSRAYFDSQNALINELFDHSQLTLTESGVTYKNIHASTIIFCEGHKSTQNPFWKQLPFENAMGTVLTLNCNSLPANTIYNNGKWLCPLPNGHYKLGTTSHWDIDTLSHDLLESDSSHLQTQVQKMLHAPYTILEKNAGIRPVLKDRTPIATFHPNHPQVGIINGLGGHGCFQAPLMAQKMLDQIQDKLKQHHK